MSMREENYEHVLMCLICRSLFDDYDHQPKFLPCHHTFCKECLREYVRQMGDEIECPSCRKPTNVPAAGISALQTNFYVKYIQGLVQGRNGLAGGTKKECSRHAPCLLQYYCTTCEESICQQCCASECADHQLQPLATASACSQQQLDQSFGSANTLIEKKKVQLESLLRDLAEEKDKALLQIEATFEQHVHTLNRRATLLKNKVIDLYNEHVQKLENDLEEVSTAMTCMVSLKDYYEEQVSMGNFAQVGKGLAEMEEVRNNMDKHVNPSGVHILFEEKHGLDKYRVCARDLGRVRCSRPTPPQPTFPVRTGQADDLCSPEEEHSASLLSQAGGDSVLETDSEPTTPASAEILKPSSHIKPFPETSEPPAECKTKVDLNGNAKRKLETEVASRLQEVPAMPSSSEPNENGSNNAVELPTSTTEALKKDKHYYSLVYTSYDEEELLKELKGSGRRRQPAVVLANNVTK